MEKQNYQIKCESDMDRLLWTLAAKGQVVDKVLKAELTASAESDELREYIEQRSRLFNRIAQPLYDQPGSTVYELSRARRTMGRHYEEYTHALSEFKKYESIKMMKYMQENRGDRKVAMQLLKMLRNPSSRIYRAYDLTHEADVEDFLGWWRLWRWRFPLALLERIERERYRDQAPLEALRRLVDCHNQQFTEMGPA